MTYALKLKTQGDVCSQAQNQGGPFGFAKLKIGPSELDSLEGSKVFLFWTPWKMLFEAPDFTKTSNMSHLVAARHTACHCWWLLVADAGC